MAMLIKVFGTYGCWDFILVLPFQFDTWHYKNIVILIHLRIKHIFLTSAKLMDRRLFSFYGQFFVIAYRVFHS